MCKSLTQCWSHLDMWRQALAKSISVMPTPSVTAPWGLCSVLQCVANAFLTSRNVCVRVCDALNYMSMCTEECCQIFLHVINGWPSELLQMNACETGRHLWNLGRHSFVGFEVGCPGEHQHRVYEPHGTSNVVPETQQRTLTCPILF